MLATNKNGDSVGKYTSFLVQHSKIIENVMNDTAGIKSQKSDSET